jgi:hypothetical protein
METQEYNQYARVLELKASIAPNMPAWKAPANATYNTTDRASYEAACLLQAIEMEMAEITLPDYSVVPDDDEAWAEVREQDSTNFEAVVALAVERRMKWLAGWVPPQGMEYIRRETGLKLVETFEELGRRA